MRPTERMTAAVVIATVLAAVPLFPLTQDRQYLVLTLSLAAGSAILAVAARRLRLPEVVARLLLLVPGVLGVVLLFDRIGDLVLDTTEFVAVSYAPMDPHPGFRLLTAFVLWLLFLVTEALAVGLARPGWTFPVLVLPYLVPAIVLPAESHPGYLGMATAGYVLILGTAVYNRFIQERAPSERPEGLRRGIGLAAATSLVLAWVLTGITSALIPERSSAFLDPGQLNNSVQLGDPTLDLIRNLRSPADRLIMTYQPDDGRGRYLRLSALSAFDSAGFHLVATDLMPGPLGSPQGMDTPPETATVDVEVLDFGSEWLPVPWVPESFSATGEWRYDPRTRSIVAVGSNRKLATRHLDYSVTSWDLEPTPEEIAAAAAGDPGDQGLTLDLPAELDPDVVALAGEITADAASDGERVLALLAWLRSDEFTYSTQTVEGSTMETVSDFLLSSRTGYCEQFSGSMAILARALGIPSRVVIGFLPGVENEGRFEVSVKDMHAWTEVYLDGLGWVAFDPTPTGAPGVAPVPTPSASPTNSASPSTAPTDEPVPTPTASGPPDSGGGGLSSLGNLPAWAGAVLGLLALAATPTALRRWRQWRRLRPGRPAVTMAEDAWDELRDVAVDAGRDWPPGTPRQVAAELSTGLDPEPAAAMTMLARQVERARFAPEFDAAPGLPDQLGAAAAGLHAGRGDVHPLRRLVPRSVLRMGRAGGRP